MVRLIASDLYTLFCPSRCENRIYLRQKGLEEAPPGPYEEVLYRLAAKHETSHLFSFPTVVNLSQVPMADRQTQTQEAVKQQAPVIYQGILRTKHEFGTTECEIIGEPDFLIKDGNNYIIRDSKTSRRITEKDHPEIMLQLDLYGWLYEKVFGRDPSALEVHAGTGEIIRIPYQKGVGALEHLERILTLKTADSEQYSAVGWAKCGGCPFHDHCWIRAETKGDVALVYGVDQNLATELNRLGISTIAKLTRVNETTLSALKRPWGDKYQKVGKKASSILLMARALASKQEIIVDSPAIPESPNYVMFDLEGLPPHLKELDKIYLWGLQVFGERPSQFMPALAGFGEEGDKEGWEAFLRQTETIFKRKARGQGLKKEKLTCNLFISSRNSLSTANCFDTFPLILATAE